MQRATRFDPLLWLPSLVAIALLASDLFALHVSNRPADWLLDRFTRSHAAARTPDPDIVIVDIDERSLAEMQDVAGRWPWPRAVHAELIDGLARQQPAAVVFDLTFTDMDTDRRDSDALLSATMRRHANVYVPSIRLPADGDSRGAPVSDIAPLLGIRRGPQAQPDARISILSPLALDLDVWRTGLINFSEDDDGVGRRYYLWLDSYGWQIPSLPVRIAQDLHWPIPEGSQLLLDWRGLPPAFKHVRYAELFTDLSRGKPLRPANEFTGKIVIIGSAATGLKDFRATPLSSLHPGVEILATAIDNLKNGHRVAEVPRWVVFVIGALLILGLVNAFLRLSAVTAGVTLTIATIVLVLSTWGLLGAGWRMNWASPVIVSWLLFLFLALAVYRREKQRRQRAVSMFARMVSPSVVNELLEVGATPEAMTGSAEVTVLFSDIRGFTSLSESRSPEEIVSILNRYFARQAEVIFRHGGTLDKFIGDGIMAFWGAPKTDPDHAAHAVAAALEMAQALDVFKSELRAEGADYADGFEVGIGLHSGRAIVGFIGSNQKSDFTAIGDTVNLASRVEGLTKGVARVLVTRQTLERCGSKFEFRERGTYHVKGRAQATDVFEPITTTKALSA